MLILCLSVFVVFCVFALLIGAFSCASELTAKRKELEDLQAWFKQNDANHIAERNERDKLLSQAQKALDDNAKELELQRSTNDELSKSINEFAQTNRQLNAEIVSLQNALSYANKSAATRQEMLVEHQLALNESNKTIAELKKSLTEALTKPSIFAGTKKRGKQV